MTVPSDEDADLVGTPFLSGSDRSHEMSCRKPTLRKLYDPGDTPTKKAAKAAKKKRKMTKDMIADLVAKPAKKSKKGTTSHTRAVNFLPDADEVISKAYCAASHNNVKGSDQKGDELKHDVWHHLSALWDTSKLDQSLGTIESRWCNPDKVISQFKALQREIHVFEVTYLLKP
jgi:hypothetical protein